jgi:mRNA interferase MazF
MPIRERPPAGTILISDFNAGFKAPEMVKTRPVIVISPKMQGRPFLCTVIALSTTPPEPRMPFHAEISVMPRLPAPWAAESVWIKGDMVYAAAFHRLDFIRTGKNLDGRRNYYVTTVTNEQLRLARAGSTLDRPFLLDKTHVKRHSRTVGGSRSGDSDPRLKTLPRAAVRRAITSSCTASIGGALLDRTRLSFCLDRNKSAVSPICTPPTIMVRTPPSSNLPRRRTL